MPCASEMNSCSETSLITTDLAGAGGEIEMFRVALPLVFQDAQRLVERQQLAAQLFLQRRRLGEDLGLHARAHLGAMCADGVTCADPGQGDQQQCGNDDGGTA